MSETTYTDRTALVREAQCEISMTFERLGLTYYEGVRLALNLIASALMSLDGDDREKLKDWVIQTLNHGKVVKVAFRD